jgi:hypothetical protein
MACRARSVFRHPFEEQTMKAKPVEDKPTNQSEGDRTAARRYNADQKDFVNAGRVPKAAERAAPRNAEEKAALERAEKEGRSRAKGEDPTVPGANAGRQRRS